MTPADNKAHVWSLHSTVMCPHLCVNRKPGDTETHAAGMCQEVSSLSLLSARHIIIIIMFVIPSPICLLSGLKHSLTATEPRHPPRTYCTATEYEYCHYFVHCQWLSCSEQFDNIYILCFIRTQNSFVSGLN